MAPRPHPIDPAVFYDLVKIRKAVDEATNIAVRAASGVTSAALNASLSANNGMLNGAGAAALGLGFGGTGGGAKLSRERKHRMRELATQKLSQAYHLDEIAASVATMQSASTLEDLAMHVLQRNALDYDARYVHFFHEKIPSRMMAEYTPLDPLNHLIQQNPGDGSAFRTRALTRIFKEDYTAAARDLSDGLAIAKYEQTKHRQGKDQLILASEAAKQRGSRDWRNEVQIPDEDQPSSLEAQMLFHRGNVHLAIACQHVHGALDAYWDEQEAKLHSKSPPNGHVAANGEVPAAAAAAAVDTGEEALRSPAERAAHKRHLEERRMVKSNARKALKDYLEFLKHFDYTPGIPTELAEEFIRRVNAAAASTRSDSKTRTKNANGTKITSSKATLDFDVESLGSTSGPLDAESGALVPAAKKPPLQANAEPLHGIWPPPPEIYPASQLFSEKVPASIPPYPNPTTSLALRTGPTNTHLKNSDTAAAAALADSNESVTYHPLLTDALHSLLLCHALLQTSPTELKRHAHNAARLARVCDGYPVFLAARSPARADWVEILRRASNWINLTQSWEALCRPAPLPGHGTQGLGDRGWNLGREPDTPTAGGVAQQQQRKKREQQQQQKQEEEVVRERRKQDAILEALADERVVDEESFQRAVRARERRAVEDEKMAERAARAEVSLEGEEVVVPGVTPSTPGSATPPPPSAGGSSHQANVNGPSSPSPKKPSSSSSTITTSSSATTTATSTTTANGTSSPSTLPNGHTQPHPQSKRWAQDEGKDYPISTERAEAISRWVREAPLTVEGAGKGKGKGKKSGAAKKRGNTATSATAAAVSGVVEDVKVEEVDE